MLGPFLWGRKATAHAGSWSTTPAVDLVGGWHEGYRLLPGEVIHRRRVVFVKPDYVWIEDRVEGDGEHLIEQFFHYPACSLRLAGGETAADEVLPAAPEIEASYASGAMLRLSVVGESLDHADILVGMDEPPQGWRSRAFGHREAAPVLRLRGRRRLPVTLHTVLRPLPTQPSSESPAALRLSQPGGGLAVLEAVGMPGTDLCLLRSGPGTGVGQLTGAPGLAGEVALDGEMALVRWNGDGNPAGLPVTVAGTGLRRLVVGGRTLVEVEDEPLTFSFRRLGDQAVWTGDGGGRVRIWAPGITEVHHRGRRLSISRDGDDAVVLEPGKGN